MIVVYTAYCILTPIQEFVARGVIQGSLEMFLTGKNKEGKVLSGFIVQVPFLTEDMMAYQYLSGGGKKHFFVKPSQVVSEKSTQPYVHPDLGMSPTFTSRYTSIIERILEI